MKLKTLKDMFDLSDKSSQDIIKYNQIRYESIELIKNWVGDFTIKAFMNFLDITQEDLEDMEDKEKCQYCERWIDSYEIRCPYCNKAWNEGRKFGENSIKTRLGDFIEEDLK